MTPCGALNFQNGHQHLRRQPVGSLMIQNGRPNTEKKYVIFNMAIKLYEGLYLHYLKWIRDLKSDGIHKEIMATLRRYMDDDDMDLEEAAEAAVDKRKFLLNRVFKPVQIPEDTSDQEEDDVVRHRTVNEWPSPKVNYQDYVIYYSQQHADMFHWKYTPLSLITCFTSFL